jgi:hypothetical protein
MGLEDANTRKLGRDHKTSKLHVGFIERIAWLFPYTSSSVISVTGCEYLVQMRDQLLPKGGVATPSINKLVNYSAGHFVIVLEN